jgi:hypothetical protein
LRGYFLCCKKRTYFVTSLEEWRNASGDLSPSESDDDRQSVENQCEKFTEFCKSMGWNVVAEFQDARSEKSLDRPVFSDKIYEVIDLAGNLTPVCQFNITPVELVARRWPDGDRVMTSFPFSKGPCVAMYNSVSPCAESNWQNGI